ncbi:MAG TPA: hypothetical protein VFD89_00090 [Clostridia bacterium]|nr:hypothetical protein [Clostridia bacterium]
MTRTIIPAAPDAKPLLMNTRPDAEGVEVAAMIRLVGAAGVAVIMPING